jgi:hypothetical protein
MSEHFRNGITVIPEARRALDEGRSFVFSDYKDGADSIPAGTTKFWSILNSSKRKGLWLYYPLMAKSDNFVISIIEGGVWTLGGNPFVFSTANPVLVYNRKRTIEAEELIPYFGIFAQPDNLVHTGESNVLIETAHHSSPSDIPALFLGPFEMTVLSIKNASAAPAPYGIEVSIEQDYI